jgi:mono/diheme cytochrome c family protein
MARMTCAAAVVLVVTVLVSAAPTAASAQQTTQTAEAVLLGTGGDALFKTYCASCHGKSAKGDGPLADSLRYRPPDLTLIAKRNKGKFDSEKVYRIIDGREPVKGHGGTDMPVWGDAFKRSVDGYSEKAVKERIQALADYLKSIQAPAK